jgi:predicted nucleic acid-binding Zn finger protein
MISLAQTSSPPTAARTPPPKVERAMWVEGTVAAFGLSQEDFRAMGFSKLTQDEYGKVLTWEWQRLAQANSEREALKAESQMRQTYSCGRSAKDEATTSAVKIFVEIGENTPSELKSGVNQGFRGISDIEITYDKREADLTVSLIGLQNHLENNDRAIGYVVSTITSQPCVGKFGTNSWDFDEKSNHYLVTGPDLKSVVNQIVTDVDAEDIENMRKEHAQFKKMYKQAQ